MQPICIYITKQFAGISESQRCGSFPLEREGTKCIDRLGNVEPTGSSSCSPDTPEYHATHMQTGNLFEHFRISANAAECPCVFLANRFLSTMTFTFLKRGLKKQNWATSKKTHLTIDHQTIKQRNLFTAKLHFSANLDRRSLRNWSSTMQRFQLVATRPLQQCLRRVWGMTASFEMIYQTRIYVYVYIYIYIIVYVYLIYILSS